jgi:NADH-quinone oxidoreductase subunit N
MIADLLHLLKHELLLTGVLFILLLLKLSDKGRNGSSWAGIVNGLLLVNFALGLFGNASGELFHGLFINSPLLHLEKNILNLGILLVSLIAFPYVRSHHHTSEFYMLLVSTLLGMFFMLSAGHLLLFYIGLELATIPLAALANFNLNRSASSEAGVKMILSSAFSSALMLMGISLIYGTTGSLRFSEIAAALSGSPLQLFAFTMILTGFAFKLSAVPFHFWTADVYEGAPVPVTAYLSVISKAAVAFTFTGILYTTFGALSETWYFLLFILAMATILVGNLFALRQQNIKRFLAFSSIAQVGFILAGLSSGSTEGQAAVVYFLLIYLFSNLAAFGVVTLVSATSDRERIDDYKGFYKTHPVLSWVLTIALFSLAGVPPTAGFFGKLFLLTAGASTGNYVLTGFAALNMVISMYYYLRIVKAIFMDENEYPVSGVSTGILPGIALAICIAGILLTGFSGPLYAFIHSLSNGI